MRKNKGFWFKGLLHTFKLQVSPKDFAMYLSVNNISKLNLSINKHFILNNLLVSLNDVKIGVYPY